MSVGASSQNHINLATYSQALQHYTRQLIKRLPLIIGLGVVGGVITFGIRSMGSSMYTSTANLALLTVRARYQTADSTFTTSEALIPNYLDDSRWKGLNALATSQTLLDEVHDIVYDTHIDFMDDNEIKRNDFLLITTADQQGDVLRLNVSYPDPDIAAFATNTWSTVYRHKANIAYIPTGYALEETDALIDKAHANYINTIDELTAFELAVNISDSQQQLTLLTQLIADYNEEISGNYDLMINAELSLSALKNNLMIIKNQSQSIDSINYLTLILSMANTSLMRIDQEEGDQFGASAINLDLASLGTGEKVLTSEEIDSFLNAIDMQLTTLANEKEALLRMMSSSTEKTGKLYDDPAYQELVETHVQVRATFKDISAQYEALKHNRDLAYKQYTLTTEKVAEVKVLHAFGSPQVRQILPANVPLQPDARQRVRSAVIVAVAISAMMAAGIVLSEGWLLTNRQK